MNAPTHYDCPYCLAPIELDAHQQGRVNCPGCQRKIAVPENVLAMLSERDEHDEEDFLSGVPLKAIGDEDILTPGDLAVEPVEPAKPQHDGIAASEPNLLEKEFDFAVADQNSPAEHNANETADRDNDSAATATAADSETDLLLEGFHDSPETDDEQDLNRLVGGGRATSNPLVEKGSYGIRCSVCDSRLLVTLRQVGEMVKCSDCFSMVKVRPPTRKEKTQIEKQIGLPLDGEESRDGRESGQSDSADHAINDDDELTLAPLADDDLVNDTDEPEIEAELIEAEPEDDQPLRLREEPVNQSNTGTDNEDFADVLLEPEEDDSAAASGLGDSTAPEPADVLFDDGEDFPDTIADDVATGESKDNRDIDSSEILLADDLLMSGPLELEDASFINPADLDDQASAAGVSKNKRLQEKPSRDQDNTEQQATGTTGSRKNPNPYKSRSAQQAAQAAKRERAGYHPNQKKSGKRKSRYPEMRFENLFGAAVELVMESGVAVRAGIAAALMATGNVIAHFALAKYDAIDTPTMGDTAMMGMWRFGVGWVPYAIGTILLWYFCGVVFRETASGQRKIKSWHLGPTTEWTSTLLMTAISFAVAGSPVLMLMSIYITAPVRFFLALPFLVAVWYAQSPFAILSADVVGHFRKQGKQWQTVFLVVFALASLAFVSGLLMHIPLAWLCVLTSTLGAVFLSFVTLAFAAVAGWHSGMVVEELS